LLAELDDDDLDVRDRASAEVERLGDAAAPALREALGRKPSLEAALRMERILERVGWKKIDGSHARLLRAVEALEQIGTPEAAEVLRSVAAGPDGSRLTDEARAALARLKAKAAVP
jgi:hypothetical protein